MASNTLTHLTILYEYLHIYLILYVCLPIYCLITTSLFFYGYVCGPILLFPIQAADLDNVLLFLNNSAYLSICPFYLFIYTHLCISMFFYLAISSYVHLSVYLRTRTRWLISIIQYYLGLSIYIHRYIYQINHIPY